MFSLRAFDRDDLTICCVWVIINLQTTNLKYHYFNQLDCEFCLNRKRFCQKLEDLKCVILDQIRSFCHTNKIGGKDSEETAGEFGVSARPVGKLVSLFVPCKLFLFFCVCERQKYIQKDRQIHKLQCKTERKITRDVLNLSK